MAQGRRMKSACQKSQHVLVIPGGLLATSADADPGCSVTDAAVILAERDIQDPMETVFPEQDHQRARVLQPKDERLFMRRPCSSAEKCATSFSTDIAILPSLMKREP